MHTILLMDDEELMIEILIGYLAKKDRHFIAATNGVEGLEKVKNNKIDLIISDIRMPNMDGIEFINTLYKKLKIHIPIIFISAFGNEELNKLTWKAGAFDFVAKPIDSDRITHDVDEALKYGKEHLEKFLKENP